MHILSCTYSSKIIICKSKLNLNLIFLSFLSELVYWVYVARCWQQEGCRGSLCEEEPKRRRCYRHQSRYLPAAPGDSTVEQISTLQSGEDPMMEQVYPEQLKPMGRTHAGAVMDRPQPPFPISLQCLEGRGVGNKWVKLTLGKRMGEVLL